MFKQCPKCKRILPLSNFHKKRKSKDGRQPYCKTCNVKQMNDAYHTDPLFRERVLNSMRKRWRDSRVNPQKREELRKIQNKKQRKYRKTHREKIAMLNRAKVKLRKSGLREIVWARAKGRCELCGEEVYITRLKSNCGFHHLNKNPFDNRLENLILVCTRCHLQRLHKQSVIVTVKT